MKFIAAVLVVLSMMLAARADEPTTTAAQAAVTPEAATVLADMEQAYAKLSSLDLAGKITGEFDVDGQKANETSEFTTSYSSPNKFRHQMQQDGVVGSTGEKLYIYTKARNAYLSVDAPKQKTRCADLPEPFNDLLGQQNLSLALAMSPDPAAELKAAYAKIDKAAAVEVDQKSYTALSLTSRDGDAVTTLLIDPATNLLRRASMDLAPQLKARGANDVKKALVTIDYVTVTPDAPVQADAFAWTPPAGAKDAAEMAEGDETAHELVGKPAPDFKLKDLEDKDVALADLKGSVVVLDFWATWCGPCVASLPKIDKLAQEMKDGGVKVFAVNEGEDKELVQGFMKSKKLTLPVLLDTDSKVGNDYMAQAIPETVVVGKDGVVRAVFVGAGPDTEEKLRAAINAAVRAE